MSQRRPQPLPVQPFPGQCLSALARLSWNDLHRRPVRSSIRPSQTTGGTPVAAGAGDPAPVRREPVQPACGRCYPRSHRREGLTRPGAHRSRLRRFGSERVPRPPRGRRRGGASARHAVSAVRGAEATDRGTAHDQARGVIVRLQDVAELVGGAEPSDAAVGENGTERRRRERIGVDVNRPVGQQDLLLLAVGLKRADVVAIFDHLRG